MDRRDFITHTARTCYGVSLGLGASRVFADTPVLQPGVKGTADSVIYLFINGGLTHLDSFDPKPEAATSINGGEKALSTNVDGIQLGSRFPLLAKHADKICLLRGMTSTQGAHEQGRYFMRTGYPMRSSIVHPFGGSWAERLDPRTQSTLPSSVTIGAGNEHPGAGFLGAKYSPLPIGRADDGLKDSRRLKHVSEQAFARQLALRDQLDSRFDEVFATGQAQTRAYDEVFDAAVKLMQSKDLEAFDIGKESKATAELYGKAPFSRGCLLARRLVEHGTRFVEVEFNGFDWHDDVFSQADSKLPVLDQALSALLHDLESRGMLDRTLVVLGTEFGRTPTINQNAGRDHYPKAFSTLMAGGGIKGGYVHGATDATASEVSDGKATAKDVNATIARALGVAPDQVVYSESKRPFSFNGKTGEVLPVFA